MTAISENSKDKPTITDDELDGLLEQLPREEIAPSALLDVRKALADTVRGTQTGQSDIMTLEEVTGYLRISQRELAMILPDLPLFELAGQLRVRRQRLVEWIEKREKEYVQASIRSAVQEQLTLINKEIVA